MRTTIQREISITAAATHLVGRFGVALNLTLVAGQHFSLTLVAAFTAFLRTENIGHLIFDFCSLTFLFLAYLGREGRPFIVNRSVAVSMMLFSYTGSMNGAMSFAVPQRAEPYSRPCRNFLALLAR